MCYLKGDAKVITQELENLWLNPPKDWVNCECKDQIFPGKYIWFKYVGSVFPRCKIYIPKTIFSKDMVKFMISPKSNDDEEILKNCAVDIMHSLFDSILNDKIELIVEE